MKSVLTIFTLFLIVFLAMLFGCCPPGNNSSLQFSKDNENNSSVQSSKDNGNNPTVESSKDNENNSSVQFSKDNYAYIIPLYSYPVGKYEQEWQRLYNLTTVNDVFVIVNADNGPGGYTDPNFLNTITTLKSRGFKVIGYVFTRYGSRSLEDVKNDMDKWLNFYGSERIDGFFIDEVAENYDYYREVFQHARSKNKLIILNPGTNIDARFFTIADKIVVFESPLTSFENFNYVNYTGLDSKRICTIVYETPQDKVSYVENKAKQNNSRCLYIHDRGGSELYFYLSPYLR